MLIFGVCDVGSMHTVIPSAMTKNEGGAQLSLVSIVTPQVNGGKKRLR